MYSIPVASGLINGSTISSPAHGANMEQIISELTSLKAKGLEIAQQMENQKHLKTFLENLIGLYCIVPVINMKKL